MNLFIWQDEVNRMIDYVTKPDIAIDVIHMHPYIRSENIFPNILMPHYDLRLVERLWYFSIAIFQVSSLS